MPSQPDPPEMLSVEFGQLADDSLSLSPSNYRKLEKNINRLRAYAAQLQALINYYQKVYHD